MGSLRAPLGLSVQLPGGALALRDSPTLLPQASSRLVGGAGGGYAAAGSAVDAPSPTPAPATLHLPSTSILVAPVGGGAQLPSDMQGAAGALSPSRIPVYSPRRPATSGSSSRVVDHTGLSPPQGGRPGTAGGMGAGGGRTGSRSSRRSSMSSRPEPRMAYSLAAEAVRAGSAGGRPRSSSVSPRL